MGCCCCKSTDGNDDDNNNGSGGGRVLSEMEMKAKRTAKSMAIARHMCAPTIRIGNNSEIYGSGLALIGIALEQDKAYWEWHIELPPKVHIDTVLFGVTTKKSNTFYKELEDKVQPEEGVPSVANGTNLMRRIELQNGDVVGVAMQQSDLPMIQFYLNDEPLFESAINRFRGTVYPAICLPPPTSSSSTTNGGGGGNDDDASSLPLKVHFVMDEDEFKYKEQGQKFGPIIMARNIV